MGLTLGGSNTWSLQMAGELHGAGRKPLLLCHPSAVEGSFELKPPAGVGCVSCPGRGRFISKTRYARRLAELYGQVLPGVLVPNFSNETHGACAQLSLTRAEDMRVIGIVHGQGGQHLNCMAYYESVIHKFIAVSDEVAADVLRLIPHRADDLRTRACAVEVSSMLNRTYSPARTPLQLVYAGRITNHEKRVYKLLSLAEEVQKRGIDFHLRIIGDGGFRWGLNKAISELPPDLRKRIALEPPVSPEELAAVWDQTDVCVLVSDKEGTAVSMLEAMAHGCVPVVTRVSGTAAVIDHGVNGFVADIDDLEAMAGHIAELASDRAVLAEYGRRGYEKISAGYALKDYMEWFLKLVDGVWQEPPRKWDAAKPIVMPNPPDICPGPWSIFKSRLLGRS